MVTVTIDGNEIQVADGTNLVEAAKQAGVTIPTFCYHPALRVVGQCRICFVEVVGMPRLVTACSTPAQDGMEVVTTSDKVKQARSAVMEFLLANHPLDCPVCDQAGECLLQDYSVDHGADSTHMVDERRTFAQYERRELGPHVIQNQNRCIHCTRCIRFCEEIAETGDLTMKSRGNHAFIDTFSGEPLDNPMSACVADVCPVGALTVKEFRFRARVWHLEETPSICPGCSIGCSITVDHLDKVVHRFKPRFNPEINGWWMCDYGRASSEELNQRDVHHPAEARGGSLVDIDWSQALRTLEEWIAKGTRVIASANMSNEGLYLVKKLLVDHAGLEVVVPLFEGEQRRMKNSHGEWIASASAHPNSTGARLIGLPMIDEKKLKAFCTKGSSKLLVLDNRSHPWLASKEAASALVGRSVAVSARVHTALSRGAELVLPAASWIGMEGSYTSSTGRVQLTRRGFYPLGTSKPLWEILWLLSVQLGLEKERTVRPQTVFSELAEQVPAFAGMTYRRLANESGIPVLEEDEHVG